MAMGQMANIIELGSALCVPQMPDPESPDPPLHLLNTCWCWTPKPPEERRSYDEETQ